jgi:regulator-associated protein of mTOR
VNLLLSPFSLSLSFRVEVAITNLRYSGTSHHAVKVFNFDGTELSRVEPYYSFLNHTKGTPITSTAFHPHRMMLACAAKGDYHVNLFACGDEGLPETGGSF